MMDSHNMCHRKNQDSTQLRKLATKNVEIYGKVKARPNTEKCFNDVYIYWYLVMFQTIDDDNHDLMRF